MASSAPQPPWTLLSPYGVRYHVRDRKHLEELADSFDVRRDRFLELVGLTTSSQVSQPQLREQWQLFSRVIWLQLEEDATQMIYVSGDAKHFVQEFAHLRADTQHFQGQAARLQSFLNGNLQSNGKKTVVYGRKGIPFHWRKMDSPPVDAWLRVPSVAVPSSYAQQQVSQSMRTIALLA